MKIADIEAIHLAIPFSSGGQPQAGVWGAGGMSRVDSLVLKVTADDGRVGWGEAFGFVSIPAVSAAIQHIVAPAVRGQRADAIEPLMQDLQRRFHIFGRSGAIMFALSALDIALWDLKGRALGVPVHALLGGTRRTSIRCYASLIRYTDPEVVARNVWRAVAGGYRHIKLHEVEMDAITAARAAAGDEVEITLDVNCPWTVRQALDKAQQLRAVSPRWLEEPVWPPENYQGLAQVRQGGGIPVAAGENASTLHDFQQMLAAGAVDFVQPSPAKMGGITELRKVFALAAAHNTTVMVHSFYDGPGLLAAVHATAALGGDESLVEWRYLDLEAQLYGPAILPREGCIAVPSGPGLGLDPDPDVIRDYRVAPPA